MWAFLLEKIQNKKSVVVRRRSRLRSHGAGFTSAAGVYLTRFPSLIVNRKPVFMRDFSFFCGFSAGFSGFCPFFYYFGPHATGFGVPARARDGVLRSLRTVNQGHTKSG
jgi:hypothetical protein